MDDDFLGTNQKLKSPWSPQTHSTPKRENEEKQSKWMEKMSNCAYKITHLENSFLLHPVYTYRLLHHSHPTHHSLTHYRDVICYELSHLFFFLLLFRFFHFHFVYVCWRWKGVEDGTRRAANTFTEEDKLLYFPFSISETQKTLYITDRRTSLGRVYQQQRIWERTFRI